MNNNLVLVSAVIIYKNQGKGRRWFIVRHSEDGGWEIPKAVVRKVESSVRAVIRMMGEQGGMSIKVLEEAGRAGGVTRVNNKILPQRHIYYLATHLSSEGEVIGFEEHAWLDYAKAVRKLSSKRERMMLKQARKELIKWLKEQGKTQDLQK
jgi:ADP-ribose pyrophosphatase YjhB (NUDIX family)